MTRRLKTYEFMLNFAVNKWTSPPTRPPCNGSGKLPDHLKANPKPICDALKQQAYDRCVVEGESWQTVGPELGWATGSSRQSSVQRWAKKNLRTTRRA